MISNINDITSNHEGAIDGEDPVLFEDSEPIRSVPRNTIIDDVRHTQYANCQVKWLSDSFLSQRAKLQIHLSCLFQILTSELHRICHIFLSTVCVPAPISTHCRFTVSLENPLSQQRSSFNQMCDVLSRGYDPISHAHRARCLTLVRPIFGECCHVRTFRRGPPEMSMASLQGLAYQHAHSGESNSLTKFSML